MILTKAQHRCLEWLDRHDGHARLRGDRPSIGTERAPGAPVAWLHLVAKGLLSGESGELRITEYGRRVLNPLASTKEVSNVHV